MARLKTLEREEVSPEVHAIYDKYLQERGNVPNAFKTWAQLPNYLTTLIAHYRAVMFTGNLPFKLKELLVVKVSLTNNSNY
ncbi:MAG: hypothetical protein AAB354_04255 [candidate division KSB1 bacterium]